MLTFLWDIPMATKRTHVVLPAALIQEIDSFVGRRGRSRFLTEAARNEVRRLRALKALRRARGTWKDVDYPELRAGAAQWVTDLRRGEEARRQRRRH